MGATPAANNARQPTWSALTLKPVPLVAHTTYGPIPLRAPLRARYQPRVPRPPLNGPSISLVIQPP